MTETIDIFFEQELAPKIQTLLNVERKKNWIITAVNELTAVAKAHGYYTFDPHLHFARVRI